MGIESRLLSRRKTNRVHLFSWNWPAISRRDWKCGDLRPWAATTGEISPVFSGDGKTIIFSRSSFYGSYSPIAQPHYHGWRFYVSDLDGTNVRELTSESFYMASPASASADGKSMVVETESIDTGRQIAIYALDRPGQPIQSLRPHVPKEADHKDPIFNFPNFMPD